MKKEFTHQNFQLLWEEHSHSLPTASDDRAGLAGSLNVISTHIGFTTNDMTDFAKSQKDYTIHFQAAFLHGLNLLFSPLHFGALANKTYYLTINCPGCTKEIKEDSFSLSKSPIYQGIPLEHFPAQAKPEPISWYGDPAVAAGFKLGTEIIMSLYQESRELDSLLDSGQSPRHLERFSLSHLAPLPGHLIMISFWYAGNLRRSLVKPVSSYLKAVSHIPTSSPVLRWVCDVMFSLSDGNQIFDLTSEVGALDKLLPAGTSLRNAWIAKLLLVGLVSQSPEVTRIMRRMKLDNIE